MEMKLGMSPYIDINLIAKITKVLFIPLPSKWQLNKNFRIVRIPIGTWSLYFKLPRFLDRAFRLICRCPANSGRRTPAVVRRPAVRRPSPPRTPRSNVGAIHGWNFIRPSHAPNKIVDQSAAHNGANIHLWDWHGGNNQQWRFQLQSDGSFRIQSLRNHHCWDVHGWSKSNGGNIVTYPCHNGANQRWMIIKKGAGYELRSVHSGKCADIAGWGKGNGANLHQWACHGGKNQIFKIGTLPTLQFGIRTKHAANKVVDESAPRNGATIHLWSWHGGSNQKWSLIPRGHNIYSIQSRRDRRCWDVQGWSRANGSRIVAWDCHTGNNQRWRFTGIDGAYFEVKSIHSGKCADIAGWGRHNGARLHQWACHRGNNQKFKFSPL